MGPGGSWSVYWYNGVIVSSEIARGLDIFELVPSAYISQNELDAAKTIKFDYLNTQGQPKYVWPATPALAKAYLDQLERSKSLSSSQISAARKAIDANDKAAMNKMATDLAGAAKGADAARVTKLSNTLKELAAK